MEVITYTTIIHQAREELEITTNEYCVADIIYHLSNNPKSKVQGWCYASRQKIGEFIGITKPSVLSIIEKLEKKEIIEKDEETKYLRTTEKWYNIVVITRLKHIGKETIPSVKKTTDDSKETLPTAVKKTTASGKETLPNIYNDSNINNNKIITYTEKDKNLTDLLYKLVKQNYPFLKEKDYSKDYAEMNRLHRIDEWTYEQIEYIIKWSQRDSFWKQNIRSVSKLRKQFENLVVRAKENQSGAIKV